MNDYELPNSIHIQICQLLGWKVRIVNVDTGGLSSARVWRLQSTSDLNESAYCLKRMESGSMTLERLLQVHQVMASAHGEGCEFIPKLLRWSSGTSYLLEDGRFWELTQWLPGEPVASVGAVTGLQIGNGMAAVAKLHQGLRRLGSQTRPSPGVASRLENVQRLTSIRLDELDRKVESIGDVTLQYALHRILRSISNHKREFEIFLEQKSSADLPCQWILRDLWREHVLFLDEAVTGIIDFGASQVDWPGFDLVRLLGSWLVPGDSRWVEAISLYNKAEAGARILLNDVLMLDRVSTLLSGIQWIEWLSDGVFDSDSRGGRVKLRIQELAARLDV